MKKFLDNTLNNQSFAGWVFILPALIGTFIFIIIPVICSFGLSFSKWDLLNPIQFVGLANYKEIFSEPLFYKIFWNTVVFALTTSIFGVIIPLILACILNSKIRGSEFYKTAYFLPFITPMIVIGVVWEWIFDPNIGLLNHILHLHINWLYDTHFAMPALIIVSVWKLIGYNMVIFLSSLSGISQSLFEAAKIDGANNRQLLRYVTLPMVMPSITICSFLTLTNSFKLYDQNLALTAGEPSNKSEMLALNIYNTFYGRAGWEGVGQAKAVIFFLAVALIAIVQLRMTRSKEVQA